MPKFAFFFDGTGNGPCDKYPSNVFKLYNAFDKKRDVIPLYYEGPGASEYDVFAGKIAGSGIIDNIKRAYRDLAKNYEESTQIALFGFSRGAYTVHMFAWLLKKCGIPLDINDCDIIVDRFVVHPESPDISLFNLNFTFKIDFIGVWDIVKSVKPNNDYMDGTLPDCVNKVFHAMAMDELRKNFPVMKWRENGFTELHQIWFAGVHSDVGGGYARHGLSDIAYEWIQNAVVESGFISDLSLPKDFKKIPNQELNNPFEDDPRWNLLGWRSRHFNSSEDVHESVYERHRMVPDYMPEVSGWQWT